MGHQKDSLEFSPFVHFTCFLSILVFGKSCSTKPALGTSSLSSLPPKHTHTHTHFSLLSLFDSRRLVQDHHIFPTDDTYNSLCECVSLCVSVSSLSSFLLSCFFFPPQIPLSLCFPLFSCHPFVVYSLSTCCRLKRDILYRWDWTAGKEGAKCWVASTWQY